MHCTRIKSEIRNTYNRNYYISKVYRGNHTSRLLLEQKTKAAIIKSPNNSIISKAMIMAIPRNKLIAPPIFGSKSPS